MAMDYPSKEIQQVIINILDEYEKTGQKITAIKEIRSLLQLGLKEAKEFVEASDGGVRDLDTLFRAAGVMVTLEKEQKSRKLRPEQHKLALVEIYKKANVDLKMEYPDNGVSIYVTRKEVEVARVLVHEESGNLILIFNDIDGKTIKRILVKDILL